MIHFATYNIRKRVADDVAAHWGGVLYFDPQNSKATVVPRYRKREVYRRRARREHRAMLLNVNKIIYQYEQKRNCA